MLPLAPAQVAEESDAEAGGAIVVNGSRPIPVGPAVERGEGRHWPASQSVTGRHYSGINVLVLWTAVIDGGYRRWLQAHQLHELMAEWGANL